MRSKIFLCLLLIVAMLAFVGCTDDNGTSGTLRDDARDMVNDVENGLDDMANDVTDNQYGANRTNDGLVNPNRTTDSAVGNDHTRAQ